MLDDQALQDYWHGFEDGVEGNPLSKPTCADYQSGYRAGSGERRLSLETDWD